MSHPKLPRSPLVLVVAQIRFSPVESIEKKYIPMIQEKLRSCGYPYFAKGHINEIIPRGGGIQVLGSEQWFFTDKKRRTNIVLTKNSLAVNTVDYSTFDGYLVGVQQAIVDICGILGLKDYAALEQVSLRYVDWIRPLDGKQPEELVKQEYLGGFIDNDNDVRLRQVIIERNSSAGGIVRIVLFSPFEPSSVLGEFQAIQLELPKLADEKSRLIILDMDHIKEMKGIDFSEELITSTLNELHLEHDKLFFHTIPTQEAINLWKKEGEQ